MVWYRNVRYLYWILNSNKWSDIWLILLIKMIWSVDISVWFRELEMAIYVFGKSDYI